MTLDILLTCLALNIYHEARGEPVEGQIAVAYVTLNRAKENRKDVCSVVTKPYQFSWTITGLKPVAKGFKVKETHYPKEHDAWELAKTLSLMVAYGKLSDPTKGATYFHSKEVKPYWAKHRQHVTQIGNHIFYRKI